MDEPGDGDDPLRMLSVGHQGGIRLKNATVWGPNNPGRSNRPSSPPPMFSIQGHGVDGGVPTPRSGLRPSSPRMALHASPPAASCRRVSPPMSSRGSRNATAHQSGAVATPLVSNVMLTLDASPISSRRLAPTGLPSPHVHIPDASAQAPQPQPPSSHVMRQDHSPSASHHSNAADSAAGSPSADAEGTRIMPAAPPPEPMPDDLARGGADEIAWLHAQIAARDSANAQLSARLQRVQQESHAIRSSLMAQQQKVAEDRTPAPPPARRGSISAIAPRPIAPLAKLGKSRQQRKRTDRKLTRTDGDLSDEDADGDGAVTQEHAKDATLSRRILETLRRKAPFDGHSEADLTQLVAAMAPFEVTAGVNVLQEGEIGDLAYWVESGELSVIVDGEEVDTIGPDTVFGEVALVYDILRTATVRAKTECSMWLLHRAMFQHILRDKAIAERKATFTFLKTVKIFASLSGRQISRIADVVEAVIFEADAAIITEGDEADSMYIIQEGQAVVSQSVSADSDPGAGTDGSGSGGGSAKSLLRILKAGDYFGERALLSDEKRSATVTAASKVEAIRLDKHTFVHLLGNLHAELKKRAPRDAHRGAPSNASPPPIRSTETSPQMTRQADLSRANSTTFSPLGEGSSPMHTNGEFLVEGGSLHGSPSTQRPPNASAAMLRNSHVNPADIVMLKALGSGGYGRVALVRDRKTRRVYALKRACRAHLLAHNAAMRCEWMARERRVLLSLHHPFIVQLYATYADGDNIFLLLEAAMGGDLYRLIEKLQQVPEKVARFYSGSLVLALAHIHALEIVYRDLKPENVLVDAQGYLKLCDFGFAKKLSDRTYTRCGTPDYTAPEMLLNQGVNQACDWWALGILLFEMVVGYPPFTDPDGDDMQTYANITHGTLSSCYPEDSKATDEARALIQGLCTVKVAYRLGYLKGGAEDVIAHAWFAGFDFDACVNRTLEPPWRPNLASADDTGCFEGQDSGDSLDGPDNKSHPKDIVLRWEQLQEEYAGSSTLQEMSHLLQH